MYETKITQNVWPDIGYWVSNSYILTIFNIYLKGISLIFDFFHNCTDKSVELNLNVE